MLQHFLQHATQILGYRNLKLFSLQSPPLLPLDQISGLTFQGSLPLTLLWTELIQRLQTLQAVPSQNRVLSMSHSAFRGLPAAHMFQNCLIHGAQVVWSVLLPPGLIHRSQHFHSSSHWGSILSSTDTAECPGHLPAQAQQHCCCQNIPRHSGERG